MNFTYIKKVNFMAMFFTFFLLNGNLIAQIYEDQQKELKRKKTSVYQKIEQDFIESKIDVNEWARELVYALFDRSKLSEEYKNIELGKTRSWIFKELFNNWMKLNQSTKEILYKYGFNNNGALSPPSGLDSTRESTHFKFHYSVVPGDTNAVNGDDSDTNGIPDYIDTMMSVFENVYSIEIDSLGFTAPPSDSSSIGGSDKYDVYVMKLGNNILGLTSPFSTIGDNPNSSSLIEKNASTSYIKMRNDYSSIQNHTQLENIQTASTHELFHAIQFGYDVKEKTWLMESTATWVEDEVYDDNNQAVDYFKSWFKIPYVPLDATQAESYNHWYGSWIFFRYISEHLGGQSTIKKIWEKSVEYDSRIKDYSFVEIDEALVSVGSNFKEAFKKFALSNLYQTYAPYNYEEADLYPPIAISRKYFQTKKGKKYSSKKHSTRYFRIFPNVLPGTSDEIEFTVTPDNVNVDMELIITTKTSGIIDVISSSINAGKIVYTLQNSSTKGEIYAIIANYDSVSTDITIDVSFKGNLIQLSNSGNYNYGRFSDNYYIYKYSRQYTDSAGDLHTDFIVNRFNVKYGYVFDNTFTDTNGLEAYLAKTNGDMFIIADETNTGLQKNYGYHFASLKELAGEFQVTQFPAVDDNKMFFYGNLIISPDVFTGIYSTDLTTGNPQTILDLTNTDFKIDIIDSEGNSFVALKNSKTNSPLEELIYYNNNSLRTFYSLNNGRKIRSFVFNNNFVAWSESDGGFSNKSIKAFDFDIDSLRTIRTNDGLDVWSVATSSKRVVWWENINGVTKIKLWMNDSTTTIRNTFKGLYLSDNGVSSNSFDIPIDTGGVAWMENDFVLYYYKFSTLQLNSYDLSNYFTDKFLTTYIVRLSGDNIIIEAVSALNTEKVGIYLFKLGDIVTGIENSNLSFIPEKFSLSQNYPNPFNPSTVIGYRIPVPSNVTLKIYDVLGREVSTLVNEEKPAGNYKVNFDGSNLASGVYLYRIIAGKYMQTKKMILLK